MSLILSFVISTIGFAYLIYGKKTDDFVIMISGAALMIYPYFISNALLVLLIGIIICIIPYLIHRFIN